MPISALSTYIFGHNLEKILYPYVASIDSALALTRSINGPGTTGQVWLAICDCEDDTEKIVREKFSTEIGNGELHIVYHPWGDHHTIQAKVGNFLLDQIGESAAYALKLDADEVIYEESFENFREDFYHVARGNHVLARPHYTHFCPDFWTTFPFIYASKSVISRTSMGLRFSLGVGGDACALGGAPEVQTRLEIQHFGKVQTGRRREALAKEWTFQQLYTELGFPDPLVAKQWEGQGFIDYDEIFHVARERGDFQMYLGDHPVFVKDWIAMMEQRDKEWVSQIGAESK